MSPSKYSDSYGTTRRIRDKNIVVYGNWSYSRMYHGYTGSIEVCKCSVNSHTCFEEVNTGFCTKEEFKKYVSEVVERWKTDFKPLSLNEYSDLNQKLRNYINDDLLKNIDLDDPRQCQIRFFEYAKDPFPKRTSMAGKEELDIISIPNFLRDFIKKEYEGKWIVKRAELIRIFSDIFNTTFNVKGWELEIRQLGLSEEDVSGRIEAENYDHKDSIWKYHLDKSINHFKLDFLDWFNTFKTNINYKDQFEEKFDTYFECSEHEFEMAFCEFIEYHNGKTYKLSARDCKGAPDRLVISPKGEIYFVELKKPSTGGQLSSDQKYELNELEYYKQKTFVINNCKKALEFAEIVERW